MYILNYQVQLKFISKLVYIFRKTRNKSRHIDWIWNLYPENPSLRVPFVFRYFRWMKPKKTWSMWSSFYGILKFFDKSEPRFLKVRWRSWQRLSWRSRSFYNTIFHSFFITVLFPCLYCPHFSLTLLLCFIGCLDNLLCVCRYSVGGSTWCWQNYVGQSSGR